jgi:hypothetical protein
MRRVSVPIWFVLISTLLHGQSGRIGLGREIGRSTTGIPFPGPFVDPTFHARFLGGTLPWAAQNCRVALDLTDGITLRFHYGAANYDLSYQNIERLGYTDEISHFLLSTSRKHLVKIWYTDPLGLQRTMVFRIDNGDFQPLLGGLEGRTGHSVDYYEPEKPEAK